MTNKDIFNHVDSIEDNSVDYYKNLILGQQIYSTLLYSYLCYEVTHDYKLYRRHLREFPRENLLCKYLQEIFPNSLPHEEKLRKSYVALSVQYHIQGYDAVQSDFQRLADNYFNDFLNASLKKRDFMSAFIDSEKIDELVLKFADKYSLNYFLLRVALLTRSQMSEDYLEHVGLIPSISTKKSMEILKNGLMDWGQELLLLLSFDYCTRNRLLDSVNLSAFDVMNLNLNQGEIRSQLEKLLRLDKLCLALFEASNILIKIKLTDKDKQQIEYGLIAVFFLPNFAQEKKFIQYFNDVFSNFYSADKIKAESNYRFELLAFLSALNLKAETKYRHPFGSRVFRATLAIKNSNNALQFVCENKSKEFANKEIWRIAYGKIITPVRRFFESADDTEAKTSLSLFIGKVTNMITLSSMFFAPYGILSAQNLSRIDPKICTEVIKKAPKYADSKTLSAFLKIVCEANNGKYICINESIYSYADWIQHSYDDKKSINVEDISRLAIIYDDIVNPSIELQKKLISNDYRLVQKIYPISDELALYSLDVSPDAYNYLSFVSPSVASYYKKLKAEEINFADIGTLSTLIGTNVKISIMDSQKPFHSQLIPLISDLKIKKIKIACGYCFASGLLLLGDFIQENLAAGTPFELYIGSLQNYDESVTDNLITGIDKTTVRLLNQYLSFKNFELFTCPDRFYHGKLYIFEGEESSVVIVGSSNLSRSAFISNYELNLAFHMPIGGVLLNNFLRWTAQLRYYSKRINMLEENMFGNSEFKLDGSVFD